VRTPKQVFYRIVVLAVAVRGAFHLIGSISVARSGGGRHGLAFWSNWDANNLLRVAEVGYPRTGDDSFFIVYLPGYPFAVRAVAYVFQNLILSGLIVSFVASVGAAWFLYKLVRVERDHDEAWRSVLWLFAFPTAYFLTLPYSESLYLFGSVAALYAARTNRWARAAAGGILATVTRLQALPLVPALAIEALRRKETRARISALAWSALAGSGIAIYLAINWIARGDPFEFLEVQADHWANRGAWPWVPLIDAWRAVAGGGLEGDFVLIYWGRLVATLLAVTLLVTGRRRLSPAESVFGWTALVLILSSSWLISMPRYLIGIFPLFIVLAHHTMSNRVLWPLLSVSAAMQSYYFWHWAAGHWTF